MPRRFFYSLNPIHDNLVSSFITFLGSGSTIVIGGGCGQPEVLELAEGGASTSPVSTSKHGRKVGLSQGHLAVSVGEGSNHRAKGSAAAHERCKREGGGDGKSARTAEKDTTTSSSTVRPEGG